MPHEASPSALSPPLHRLLRAYALDPSLAIQLATAPVSQIKLKLPWEKVEPGPVGEYVEVIDYDPAGRCFYEPVDLDAPYILAQNGLAPSEGTPQFHQQMVYAVASLTIHNFEHALGRRALWSPGPSPDSQKPWKDSHYVQRLRIYPHALREPNAYYSPAKKALLFGFFPASDDDPAGHMPGSIVFTCLSHDIIAHETAHALLDGMHRRLSRPTNPDMLAFHEAFADIVALFQHFTFPEILRHQISRTRGEIRSHETMLGQLATQFGLATGMRGALRDAIGTYNKKTDRWEAHRPDPADYDRTIEPHRRGAILVAAIFDAFLAIYENRVEDLFRLYTGGSGILPPGAVHPDLVERLAEEASKAAGHVLTMCVRALDYCPPLDLTFGEYLRAVITADYDAVPDDDRNYRIAFVEAFRRRGIYPRDVRTLSVENLIWRSPHNEDPQPSDNLQLIIQRLRDRGRRQLHTRERRDLFRLARATRSVFHDWLAEHLEKDPRGKEDAAFLGLKYPGSFEVHSLNFASRVGPDGDLLLQVILQLVQGESVPVGKGSRERMRFEGGSTLIADLTKPAITYCIRKPADSLSRCARQRDFVEKLERRTLRSTYFGAGSAEGQRREPFALLHRGGF